MPYRRLSPLFLAGQFAWLGLVAHVAAQLPRFPSFRKEGLSDTVNVETAQSASLAHLTRIDAFLKDEQWDDAVETLRRVMEDHGDELMELPSLEASGKPVKLYTTIRRYGQLHLSTFPAPALQLYRDRVDPLAERWYREALASRDEGRLRALIEQLYCSSWGDEALLALGEIALERGDYSAARDNWEQIVPLPARGRTISAEAFAAVRNSGNILEAEAKLLDAWYELQSDDGIPYYRVKGYVERTPEAGAQLARFWKRQGYLERLTYPDSDIDPAAVDARLVLVSIVEGSHERAEKELTLFQQKHPEARGAFAGRKDVSFAATLKTLLKASREWNTAKPQASWPTFAGDFSRNKQAAEDIDFRAPLWSVELPQVRGSDPRLGIDYGFPLTRVAEKYNALLSYHPIIAGGRVYYATENSIFVFNLADGKPAWEARTGRPPGEIYTTDARSRGFQPQQGFLGAPRFTLTMHGDRLYARMGSPFTLTSKTGNPLQFQAGSLLVCLEVSTSGGPKLLWQRRPENANWEFEGSPVTDGRDVFIGLRQQQTGARAFVACFDAESGSPRWQRFVCSADTPGQGKVDEATHNLLTLHQGRLYYNTNLGGVAAISAADGRIQWLAVYPRVQPPKGFEEFDPDAKPFHYYRDLTPCVFHDGVLYVAPADSPNIFALDAASGRMIWRTPIAPTAMHLLGVAGGNLVASGKSVWFFSLYREGEGRVFPEEGQLSTSGRGVIADGRVYVPTHDELLIFDAASRQMVRQPIRLDMHAPPDQPKPKGGNLVVGEGHVVIASDDRMWCFRLPEEKPRSEEEPKARKR